MHYPARIRGLVIGGMFLALALPLLALDNSQKSQQASEYFQRAERMREELNGRPAAGRTRRDYERVIDGYRRVYYTLPTSGKADDAAIAIAELLAEIGRNFNDTKSLEDAIGQYEFLRREYPFSKFRFQALFTIGQIYKDDLDDPEHAAKAFQDFLKLYPKNELAEKAKASLAELNTPFGKARGKEAAQAASAPKSENYILVTGIRHWSTPDYTRVAIDLGGEVEYEAGRIPSPDRIFFDLHDTKLASVLVGKSFNVENGFLHQIRVGRYQHGVTRVVLDVNDVSEYSAFLLPNPYRLIIDIHGKTAGKQQVKEAALAAQNSSKEAPSRKEPKVTAANQPPKPADKLADTMVAPLKQSVSAVAAKPEPQAQETKVASEAKPGDKDTRKRQTVASAKPVEAKVPAVSESVEDTAPDRTVKVSKSTSTVAKLDPPEVKATSKPTREPISETVITRSATSRTSEKKIEPLAQEARPAANGERSLIRALGLKIGRIVVDAGHGGDDTGTIGPAGLQEKDLVLDVAKRLGRLLENNLGAEVIYTRDDDTFVPLETRTAIANKVQADLFISIHANSSKDPSARGIETYYLNFSSSPEALEVAARENAVSEKSIHELQDLVKKIALQEKIDESREFASDVQHSLYSGIGARTPAVRNRGVKQAPFIVLIGANMPSVLAEISFLSNPSDERKLKSAAYRQKIAEYLCRGIQRYITGLGGVNQKIAAKQSAAEPAR